MSNKLILCPFCGCTKLTTDGLLKSVICTKCKLEVKLADRKMNPSESDWDVLTKRWNTRAPLCSPVNPNDIGYGRYFIRKDSVGVNLLRFVTVDLSGRLVVYKRSNEVGTVDDYVLRGHTFFRIPEVSALEVAE